MKTPVLLLTILMLATVAHADDKATNKGKTVTNSIGMKLKLIKAGSFVMGRRDGAKGEKPRRVTIGRDFCIGVTEVTQGEWKAVMDRIPGKARTS